MPVLDTHRVFQSIIRAETCSPVKQRMYFAAQRSRFSLERSETRELITELTIYPAWNFSCAFRSTTK